MVTYNEIDDQLKKFGLCLRGGFTREETVLMVGNVGSEIWKRFGSQYDDWVEPDPLDDWTHRKLTKLAQQFKCTVSFPFEGPPYHPFQEWAMKADCVFPSPMGTLIHPIYGLWHAYRGAFFFDHPIDGLPPKPKLDSPCTTCENKPCLSACPVEAFDSWSYNSVKCLDYLNRNLDGDCMEGGCLARSACPVGTKFAYKKEHGTFHMDRFLQSHPVKA